MTYTVNGKQYIAIALVQTLCRLLYPNRLGLRMGEHNEHKNVATQLLAASTGFASAGFSSLTNPSRRPPNQSY